jgi:hypothetical protein
MPDEYGEPINGPLERLIAAWCDRRDLRPLATVLPAFTSNNGLTDGWVDLMEALRALRADRCLPADEQALVEALVALVEGAVSRP